MTVSKGAAKFLLTQFICAFVSLLLGVPTSGAATLTATLTADNHYALYFGTDSNLTFVGRNEKGPAGSPGTYNWSLPETFGGLQLSESDRFYVAIWDENIVNGSQALLGQFTTDDGGTLLTNASEWGYYITGAPNPGNERRPTVGW